MPNQKTLKIVIFPLGPAIGSNPAYTYDRCVDFIYRHKSFSYYWMARAYTLKAFSYDKISYAVSKYKNKSTFFTNHTFLSGIIDAIFHGGYMEKFIQGDITEDEFVVLGLAAFGIKIPEQEAAKSILFQDFWDVFMAHHTMIPDDTILDFKNTLLDLRPAIPVAVTRATRPCSVTTQEKLKPFGIQINEKSFEVTEENELNLLCVNKKSRELGAAAESAVDLALTAMQSDYHYTHISVHVLGHFIKNPDACSSQIKKMINEKVSCDSDFQIEAFDVKKGDTFASACHRAKLIDKPQQDSRAQSASYCAKFGIFAGIANFSAVVMEASKRCVMGSRL